MSLDLYIETGNKCPHCGGIVSAALQGFERNITHNLMPMWRKAGVLDALYEANGKRCGDYIDVLEEGLTSMLENFKEYKALDARNGWGLAEHACAFLWAVIKAARANPDGTFRVSR
jgi:hypothetical protein